MYNYWQKRICISLVYMYLNENIHIHCNMYKLHVNKYVYITTYGKVQITISCIEYTSEKYFNMISPR